jgi:hypothetical protein
MAQAPQKDIQAIINDAAAREGVDPELMQKIGGSESGHKATAKNPKSTAKGLFQFVDKTWAEMGGKPGQQYDPYKNAELGAKYIKKNFEALSSALGREPSHGEVYAAHFFGTTGAKTLLTKADPNAPIEQSLAMFENPKRVQKVLKQNPNLQGKTTGQVLEELNAKMGGNKQPAATAQEPAPSAKPSGFFRRPVPQFIRSEAPSLGTGYNAALALMGMSDDDALTTAQETVAQNEEDNSVADFGQAKQMLSSLQAPNAFAGQQPRMMAQGGEVHHMASGGFMVPFQTNILRQPDKEYLDESEKRWEEYNAKAVPYNEAINKYNTEIYNPYKSKVEAYNASLAEFQNSDAYKNYNTAAEVYNAKVKAYEAAPTRTIAEQVYYGRAPGGPGYLGDRYVRWNASGPGQEQAFRSGYQFVNTNPKVPYFGNILARDAEHPGTFDMTAPVFVQTAPTAPDPFTGVAPTAPERTQEQVLAYQKEAMKRAEQDAEQRGLAINVVNNPNRFNLAGFGSAGINAPSMFRKGGEAKSEESDRDKQAEKFFDELDTVGKDITVRPSFTASPGYVVEPGVGYQRPPTSVQGKLEAMLPLFGGDAKVGVSGMAVKPENQKLITMPGDISLGYTKQAGPHSVKVEARRSINPVQTQQGRGHMYGANVNYAYKFAEGGDVAPEKGSAKAMLKEVGRSTQYLPADIAGSPVDLLNLGLKGVDAVTGSKLAQEMPVGGSEWIIDKANKYGLMDKPTGSMTENLTRMGMGIASPTAGPRAMVAAGKAVKGTAKAALEDLAMAGTGQGGSKISRAIMEPGTAFAVRPKGGVSLGASSAADVPLTRVDESLQRIVQGIDTNTEQGQAVAGFFDKKMRGFYQNQYGTPDDPVYKAILEGRIQPSIANPRVVDAARAGDPKALQDLRRAYDASTNIQAMASRKILNEMGKHPYDMEGDVRKLIKAQSPNEDTLMAIGQGLEPKDLEKYPFLYAPKGFQDIIAEGEAGKLLRLLNKTDLQPHVRQAVAKGEPIYGSTGGFSRMLPAEEMRDYLFTRTPAEIKNMGVVDVAVKAKQWHTKMAEARKNPEKFGRKELFSGTEPVLPVESGTWVDVKTPDALSLEGNIMGHCVGGSNYCNAVAKDTTKIISLRDKKGLPHVTIQLEKTPEGFTRVAQIKGTANNSPEKYFGEINAFLDDYSSKLGKNLTITERPSFVPPQWRDK